MLTTGGRFIGVPREPYNLGSTRVPGTLIPEDANTVAHVYWTVSDNFAGVSGTQLGSIWDTKGNLWTKTGSVPFVQGSPEAGSPAGVSAAGGANYWSVTGTVGGFAGDFCVTLICVSITSNLAVFCGKDNAGSTTGWALQQNASNVVLQNRGGAAITSAATLPLQSLSVVSAGRFSGNGFVKINLTPITSGATAAVNNTSDFLGIFSTAAGNSATPAVAIYELCLSGAAPGNGTAATVDAALNVKHAGIMDSMGIGYNNALPVNGMGTI